MSEPRRIQLQPSANPTRALAGMSVSTEVGLVPAEQVAFVDRHSMGAREFGEALVAQVEAGDVDPDDIDSDWVDAIFPRDCGGLVPRDDDGAFLTEEPNPWVAGVLWACGLNWEQTCAVWEWFLSLPRQS